MGIMSEEFTGTKEAYEALQDYVDDILAEPENADFEKTTFIFDPATQTVTVRIWDIDEQDFNFLRDSLKK